MEKISRRYVVEIVPRTWFGKTLALVAALVLLISAMLFFSLFALLMIAVVPILVARAMLLGSAARQRRPENVIDGEYTVVPSERPVNEAAEQLFD